jgi:hypothetical protein
MLAIIAGFVWDLLSYNNFQLPLAAWHLLSSGSS